MNLNRILVLTVILLPLSLAGSAVAAPVGALAGASADCGPTWADSEGDGLTAASAGASVVGQTSGSSSSGPGFAKADATGTGIGSGASAYGATLFYSASASCSFSGPSPPNLNTVGCKEISDASDATYSGQLFYSPSTETTWFAGEQNAGTQSSYVSFPASNGVLVFQRSVTSAEAPADLQYTGLGTTAEFTHVDANGLACSTNTFAAA